MQGVLGTFDSLNPLIVKGLAVQAIRGYVVESLMARGYDEPFTLYGLLARTVETDEARSYVTFSLDPAARFSDGVPVTAEDVDVLLAAAARSRPAQPPRLLCQGGQGREPRRAHRAFRSRRQQRPRIAAHPRADAGAAEARDRCRDLRGNDVGETGRQRPLRRRRGRYRARASRSSAIPITGAARFRSIAACGISTNCASIITATPTPISKRSRPASTTCAARPIRAAGRPATTFPAVRDGRIVKEAFANGLPKLNSAFVFNTRRPIFSDIRVRQAISLLFDAEWVNRNFFFDLYRRSAELLSPARSCPPITVRPTRASARCWRRFPMRCAPTCSTAPGRRRSPTAPAATAPTCVRRSLCSTPPATSSRARRCASAAADGRFGFEIMVTSRDEERLALAFAGNLARAGIAGAGPPGRRRAVRPAPRVVRFRHDRESLGAVALARQ